MDWHLGHGKVILLGEHSVVYGRPALAAALGKGCRAIAKSSTQITSLRVELLFSLRSERTDPSIGFADETVKQPVKVFVDRAEEDSQKEMLRQALCALLGNYPEPHPGFDIQAEIDIPAGAGLGCSAALGVAIVRALDSALGIERNGKAVAQLSMAWERVFHGTPSGVDSTMAALGGIALFEKAHPLQSVEIEHPPWLVVGHSGTAVSTRRMVESVARQHGEFPQQTETIFDEIADLVRRGGDALKTADLNGFGQLMNRNQQLLQRLTVSTSALDQMCDAALASGALGAKLTGGGGGGCMIALVADQKRAHRVMEALNREGKESLLVRIG